jgi:glycosyltransferase involved in cell wall biosynthesis
MFTEQKYGGVSRYFYELVKSLDAQGDASVNIPLVLSNNHYISEKKYTKHIDLLNKHDFRGKLRIFHWINKLNSIREIKKQEFDVFHPTYYDPYFLKHLGNKPFVVTVYDMIHEKFADMFSETDQVSQNKKILVEKAARVIAISDSTKKDLIEIWGVDESKIEVVHLGNSMFFSSNFDLDLKVPDKYILFVGGRGAYKNFKRFIRSVSGILKQDKSLSVICAGGGKFSADETELFSSLDIDKQIQQYNLNDDTLAYLYKNAQLFVFPSLYEGFGIPVLESFACQCPLVCSNTSSLPEVAGDAACYFEPYSEDSIKSAVLKVLADKSLQEKMRKKGLLQLEKFSWQQTAMQTKKIYEDVVK